MSKESKLLTSWQPFEYNVESIKESRLQHGGKIVMKGILQKADTLNQNGRIYPRPILDDFQLICWDFVSEPSTPGAFMMREGREITPRELKKVFTKSDRLYRIYNDITRWDDNG